MILLLVLVARGCVGEEPRQDIGCENPVFVVECFPGVGLVEEKIEQGRIFLLQWGSPSLPVSSRSRSLVQRDG